jgi:hypothetical protein
MHKLYELKDMLCEELEEYGTKDKLDMGGLEIVDKLAHAIKNIDKIIDKDNYSERRSYGYEGYGNRGSYDGYGNRGSYRYDNRGSYEGESFARGRGRNARRDSMGRYASADMRMEIERLIDEAPDEETRMKLERFMQSM